MIPLSEQNELQKIRIHGADTGHRTPNRIANPDQVLSTTLGQLHYDVIQLSVAAGDVPRSVVCPSCRCRSKVRVTASADRSTNHATGDQLIAGSASS